MDHSTLNRKYINQAEMLANRVTKRFKHLYKRYARQNLSVFRLYDWDIPEIRAAVDWYDGHIVISEYTRQQSTKDWLPMMGEAVGRILNIPLENVHLKERIAGKQDGSRYERLDHTNQKIIVSERDLKFYVNLYDYVDTGLFSDHRNTRAMVKDMSAGREFLNLYCYTGSFSCYAAKGGAKTTVSVDRSESTILWARENMDLNGIPAETNILIQADTFDFLKRARQTGQQFDLAVVDPPSYSTTRTRNLQFDILRDHPELLAAVMAVMKKGATVFFSTNHQSFEPRMDELAISDVKEITALTIPEDYISKRKTIHRCWQITV
ncbi:MAG: class I SAM-dependent methyltransferase [Proteobacteria bacterium]|nr:class I SAM-dependent methyltransferase [Pseudomonadota bacterium]